jgi:hypothetical protein
MAGAVLTLPLSETYTAGSTKHYTLTPAASPPNTTLPPGWSVSPNAFAPDIQVKFSGGDCGASTYTVKLRSIIANYTNYPWGTNFPKGGWRIVKSGPNCVEWHAWQYLINDSTGKTRGYERCDMLVKALSPTGPYEVKFRVIMPNIWNTIATDSENYNGYGNKFTANAVIYNGATPTIYYGGQNDPRAKTVTFNFTNQTMAFSANTPLTQTAVIFSSSGSLPTGIAANTAYWPSGGSIFNQNQFMSDFEQSVSYPNYISSNAYGNFARCTNAGTGQKYFSFTSGTSGSTPPTGATFADGTLLWERVSPVFTDNGTGTITASPIYSAFQQGGYNAADINGDPFWVGSGSFPRVVPGHDLDYLFSSKALLPYNKSASVATTAQPVPQYGPNQLTGGLIWYQATTGDSPGDQRIGHLDNWGLVSLLSPIDPFYTVSAKQAALNFARFPSMFFYDERNGLPFAGDNGPNNSGAPYPNYPAPIPSWVQTGIPGNYNARLAGTPGNSWAYFATTTAGLQGGLGNGQYYFPNDHAPMTEQSVYLKTGCPFMEDQMVGYANSSAFLQYRCWDTYNATASYSTINAYPGSTQLRGWAWALRCLSQGLYFCSDDHPHKAVLQNAYKSHYNYQAYIHTNLPAQAKVFGNVACEISGPAGNTAIGPWQYHFLDIQVTHDYWRGGLVNGSMPDITTLFNYMSNHYAAFNSGTNIYYIGVYFYNFLTVAYDFTSCYTDQNVMWSANFGAGQWPTVIAPPAPASMINDGNNTNSPFQFSNPQFTTGYAVIAQTALKFRNIANPGDSNVATLLAQIKSDIAGQTGVSAGQGGISWTYTYAGYVQNYHCFTCY